VQLSASYGLPAAAKAGSNKTLARSRKTLQDAADRTAAGAGDRLETAAGRRHQDKIQAGEMRHGPAPTPGLFSLPTAARGKTF
jgi:hypothetical protein